MVLSVGEYQRLTNQSQNLAVTIISGAVAKTPEDSHYSFIYDELSRLSERGIEVHAVRNRYESDSNSGGIYFHGLERKYELAVPLSIPGNLLHYPWRAILGSPGAIYAESYYTSNVVRIMRRTNSKLIHAHYAYPEGFVGLLSTKRVNRPLIVTLHGYDILVDESIGYGIRRSKRINSLVKAVLQEAEAVIVASESVRREAEAFMNEPKLLHLIPNGVDLKRFRPDLDGSIIRRKLGIDAPFVVFSLRGHLPKYGLEYLIRAIPIVKRTGKDVVFVIGGTGSLLEYHRQLAKELGVSDLVILTGRIPQDELPLYYAMSSLTVVPSLQEAFGLVSAESMACGKPVIASKVGGLLDQIVEGKNGFLVQPKSPEEIAEKVQWFVDHPEGASRMGAYGRKLAEEKFDIENRVDAIVNLYLSILGLH